MRSWGQTPWTGSDPCPSGCATLRRPYLLAPPVVCGCQSLGLWRTGCWPCLPQCLLLPGPLLPKTEVLPSAVGHQQLSLSLLESHPSPLCMYIFLSSTAASAPPQEAQTFHGSTGT